MGIEWSGVSGPVVTVSTQHDLSNTGLEH